MALTAQQMHSVKAIIKTSIEKKLANHDPEPAVMPFHTRLLGKDRLALYSFIHSLNTNFGVTIFEPVAAELARARFAVVKTQAIPGAKISADAQRVIQNITDNLSAAAARPDKPAEIEAVRNACRSGAMKTVKRTRADLYLENAGEIYLIDLKTVKPNKAGFDSIKRALLEWAAMILAEHPRAQVHTLIAMPYNPYAPQPYRRWTMAGMLDLQHELKVAEEFWDFLGGEGAYENLLECFEQVGVELKDKIDAHFAGIGA